ncbi:hypothetical protein [Microbulbifer sp. JMSA003]|uniref:hypothetical protein n=1 Tax=Microbulbifer sp. JMSA003 TaxID=3243369 RepID=UPI00403A5EEF
MKYIQFLLLVLTGFSALAEDISGVDIAIEKQGDKLWKLTYQMDRPASRISFVRNPDASRIKRWKSVSPEFELVSMDGEEFLVRKDRSSFEHIEIYLTPSYISLPKDYAPFSPYSDGGSLIYTGRFFACIDNCDDKVKAWRITMQVPPGEHMIINGKINVGTASWIDRDNGMNVYVGTQEPINTASVVAVIDNGLPEKLRLSLESDIPRLMSYFEQRLGALSGTKPSLYASYANVDDNSWQGGTLPHQVFMHWNMNELDGKFSDPNFINETIWFFAHEVAHLYQQGSETGLYGDANESWLHEGNADWLAALALLDLYPESSKYVSNKIKAFKESCTKGVKEIPLVEAANRGRFDLYYSCGLLIHRAIDLFLQSENTDPSNIFSMWSSFRQEVEGGGEKGADTFLVLLSQREGAAELVNSIELLLDGKPSSVGVALDQLTYGL